MLSLRFFPFLLLVLILGCESGEPVELPTAITGSISQVTASSVSIDGQVTWNGNGKVTSRGIVYGISDPPTKEDDFKEAGSGVGVFSVEITGLEPGQRYFARAFATNEAGTAYGLALEFETTTLIPTVTTSAVSGITASGVISGGSITNDGGGDIFERGVCWGTAPNPVPTSINKATSGTGVGPFQSTVSGLKRTTKYYLRAYAINNAGLGFGDQLEFTTTADVPTLLIPTNAVATQVSPFGARLNWGFVSDDGGAAVTASGLCWSTSQNPTVANEKTTDGSAILFPLNPETKYYVRAYATNSIGTVYGASQWEVTTNRNISCYREPIYFSTRHPEFLLKQADDKLLTFANDGVLNNSTFNGIKRILANGQLDQSYKNLITLGNRVLGIFDAPDQNIFVAELDASTGLPGLYRIKSDGSVDNSFTQFKFSSINDVPTLVLSARTSNKFYVMFQIGGKIIRLENNGSIDNSFRIDRPSGGINYKMFVQTDGSVLVLGTGPTGQELKRYSPSGILDTSFPLISFNRFAVFQLEDGNLIGFEADGNIVLYNSNGVLIRTAQRAVDANNCNQVRIVKQLPGGKILVGGEGIPGWAFYRLNSDLTVDKSFAIGTGFAAQNPIFESTTCNGIRLSRINSFQVLSDGSIVVAGNFSSFNGNNFNSFIRINSDGSICQ